MPFDQGIDFRNTAIFVTDPTGCDNEISGVANYPRTSAQGNTVGWEDAPSGKANRSAAVDARLAGIAFANNGASPKRYRIDLPSSGWYRITLGLGDATTGQSGNVEVFDSTTIVSNVIMRNITQPAGNFYDACGSLRTSAADWVTNQVSFVAFFSSTICRIRIGNSATASGNTAIAHIRVTDASAPSPSLNGGVDFRATAAFVTDPTNTSPKINSIADYPHITAQGLTLGWEQNPSSTANRSAAVDARLAGIHSVLNSGTANFRVDLPATGKYRLTLALGDATTTQTQTAEIFDTSSSLGAIVTNSSTTAAQFFDATGTKRTSAADWVANQQQATFTFATQIFRIKLGGAGAGGTSSTIAHLSLTQLVGIAGTSSLSALIARIKAFAATIAGTSALAGAVGKLKSFTSTIAGTSSLSATITGLHRAITATIAGTSSLAAVITHNIKAFTATIAGTSSLSATVSTGGTVKAFTATIHGTSTFRAVVFPYQALSGQLFIVADAPTLTAGYAPSSGAIVLAAGSATQPSLIQPASGVIVVRADAPTLFTMYRPVSGVIALRGDAPTVIPYQTPTGRILLKGDAPLEQPIAGVPGRIILTGGPPNVWPLQIPVSGKIVVKGDPFTFAHVGYILNQSGIIRLRSDVPIVTPLNEPPPPPPPPPPGTGLAVSGTE